MAKPKVVMIRAIQKELALIRRAEIDADLAEMSQDVEYQAEVIQMEAEFAIAQSILIIQPY
jgi:hypothetical protein